MTEKADQPGGVSPGPQAAAIQAVNSLLHQFGSTLGVLSLYPPGHKAVAPARQLLFKRLGEALEQRDPVVLALAPREVLLDGRSALAGGVMTERFLEFFQRLGLAALAFDRSVSGEALDAFLDFCLSCAGRLDAGSLPPEGSFPGVRLSLLDYRQIMAGEGSGGPGQAAGLWEALVDGLLSGGRKDLSERELLNLASLVNEPEAFAREVVRSIGRDPDPAALAGLGALMGLAHRFLVERLGVGQGEALAAMKGCLLALPEELRLRLMELAGDSGEGSDGVRDILHGLHPGDLAGILSSSVREGASARRVAAVIELLAADPARGGELLPLLRLDLERMPGGSLERGRWEQIQSFLSASSDRYVSESYGRVLDLASAGSGPEAAVSEDEAEVRESLEKDLEKDNLVRSAYWVAVEDFLAGGEPALSADPRGKLIALTRRQIEEGRYALPAEALSFLAEAGAADPEKLEVARGMAEEALGDGLAHTLAERLTSSSQAEAALVRVILLGAPKVGSKALAAALAGEVHEGVRRVMVEMMSGLGAAARSEALKLLQVDRPQAVRDALAVLGKVGDNAAVARVAPFIRHRDGRIRREAVAALASIGSPAASAHLVEALRDEDEEVAALAAERLGPSGLPAGARQRLLSELGTFSLFAFNDARVKRTMAVAAKLRLEEAVSLLRKHLGRRRWLVGSFRRCDLALAAAEALAGIGSPAAEAAIRWGAENAAGPVSWSCAQILQKGKGVSGRDAER